MTNEQLQHLRDLAQEKMKEFLPDEELNQMLEDQVKINIDYFTNHKMKGFQPTLLAFATKDETTKQRPCQMMLIADDNFMDKKYETLFALGAKLAEENFPFMFLFFVSEAWMRKFAKYEAMPKDGKISGYEDKQEIIGITGLSLDRRAVGATLPMIRNKKGIVSIGQPILHPTGDNLNLESNILAEVFRGYAVASRTKEAAG